MLARWVCGLSLQLLLVAIPCTAGSKHISVDTGECGGEVTTQAAIGKSVEFSDEVHGLRAYGVISLRLSVANEKKKLCHVVYRLVVSVHGGPFVPVKVISLDTDVGEIAGIDIIGTSRDGTKFAADFWTAEGDGMSHRPVVYDVNGRQATDLPLEGRIQGQHPNCYQVEDFIGVTNRGEAIFAVPPNDEDDSPESPQCGDKGVWYFNLKSGRVNQVAKFSGDKW